MDVESEIWRRIREQGRITFAEFMELALFWPNGGYYSNPDNIGPKGDFYTSPSAHPAFGALVCVQVFQMWQLLDCPPTFWLVEMGAGGGLLCHDLVEYSAYLPGSSATPCATCALTPCLHPVSKTSFPMRPEERWNALPPRVFPYEG